jgi:AcrR family transcriptional regulator
MGDKKIRGVTFAQDRSRDTLRKILQAARAVFSRKGFSGATVTEIIREAGIGHGTFWLYFENKEDLLGYLLADMVEELHSFLWYGEDGARLMPARSLEEVHRIIDGVLDAFLRYSYLHPLVMEASMTSDAFRRTLTEFNLPFVNVMEQTIREHQKEGLCRELDPPAAAVILIFLLEYSVLEWLKKGIPADREKLVRQLSLIFYHTLNH